MMHLLKKAGKSLSVSYAICFIAAGSSAAFADSEAMRPFKVYIPNISETPAKSVLFSASKLAYYPDKQMFSAFGDGGVEIKNDDAAIYANRLDYEKSAGLLVARGDVNIINRDGIAACAEDLVIEGAVKDYLISKFETKMASIPQLADGANKEQNDYGSGGEGEGLIGKLASNVSSLFSDESDAEASQLAALAPAAGGDQTAAKEDKPVVGSIPLIDLPSANLPDPAALSSTAAAASVPAKEINDTNKEANKDAVKELATSPNPVITDKPIVQDAAPAANTVASDVPQSDKAAKQDVDAKPQEKQIPINDLITPAPKNMSVPAKELIDFPAPDSKKSEAADDKADNGKAGKANKKSVKSLKKAEVAQGNIEKDLKAPQKSIVGNPDGLEEEESLSPESRRLLSKVAPSITRKKVKASPEKVDVNHAHDMQDIFKAGEGISAVPAGQDLGIKVESKGQRLNIDHELEKAYDAMNAGQSEVAMESYREILDNSPNNTQALFGLATLYHRARQLDKARSLYSKLLSIDPKHRDGFNNFMVLLADEAPREALAELQKLEDKNPSFANIPAQIAIIYQKLGDDNKAMDKMFRAVALAPENLVYRYNLAVMLDKQKNYAEAAKLYKQLLEAASRGEKIPSDTQKIQQRLTFISSNK